MQKATGTEPAVSGQRKWFTMCSRPNRFPRPVRCPRTYRGGGAAKSRAFAREVNALLRHTTNLQCLRSSDPSFRLHSRMAVLSNGDACSKSAGAPGSSGVLSQRVRLNYGVCGLSDPVISRLNCVSASGVGKSHDRGSVALAGTSDVFDIFAGKGRRTWAVRSFRMVAVEFGNIRVRRTLNIRLALVAWLLSFVFWPIRRCSDLQHRRTRRG